MNSKTKILIGVLALGIVFISGLFILEQITTKPIERPVDDDEIANGLKLTIEPIHAAMEESGVYILRKNTVFQINITLENKGDRDLNIPTPRTSSHPKVLYFQLMNMGGNIIKTEEKINPWISGIISQNKITLKKGENGTFYTVFYIYNSSAAEFTEGLYKLRYVYDTIDYKHIIGFEDVHEIIVYSNNIIMKFV